MDGVAVLVPIICSLGLFALIATIFLGRASVKKAEMRAAMDLRARILERSATSVDPQVIQDAVDAGSRIALHIDILASLRWAFVLGSLGGAFYVLGRMDTDRDFYILSILTGAAGAGFLLAAVASIALTSAWGMLRRQEKA